MLCHHVLDVNGIGLVRKNFCGVDNGNQIHDSGVTKNNSENYNGSDNETTTLLKISAMVLILID